MALRTEVTQELDKVRRELSALLDHNRPQSLAEYWDLPENLRTIWDSLDGIDDMLFNARSLAGQQEADLEAASKRREAMLDELSEMDDDFDLREFVNRHGG